MTTNTPIKSLEALELAIYEEQTKFITLEFGDVCARTANYGWGVGGPTNGYDVSTKVYRKSGHVIVSTIGTLGMTREQFQTRVEDC